MNRFKYIYAPLSLFLVICFVAPAMAAEKSGNLRAPLGEIRWGDSRQKVVAKVKTQLMDRMRKDDKFKGNRVLLQREHSRLLNKVEKFEASYEELDDSSGYQVSVVSDEFSRQNGEAMMHIRDTVANRYYFFVDGGLYKMVVAYNQDYLKDVKFDRFVVQVAQKYGKPGDTEFATRDGDDVLVLATWTKGNTILDVTNKKKFFGTITMSFAQHSTAKRLAAMRKARGDDKESEVGVSAQVKSLTSVSDRDVDVDVVDSIVGDSEFDLNEGRPVDSQRERAEEEKAQKELAAKQKKQKKKKKKRKKKKSKKKSKRDFGDIEATSGGGDDLIIY